jgi:hypothetical protein
MAESLVPRTVRSSVIAAVNRGAVAVAAIDGDFALTNPKTTIACRVYQTNICFGRARRLRAPRLHFQARSEWLGDETCRYALLRYRFARVLAPGTKRWHQAISLAKSG